MYELSPLDYVAVLRLLDERLKGLGELVVERIEENTRPRRAEHSGGRPPAEPPAGGDGVKKSTSSDLLPAKKSIVDFLSDPEGVKKKTSNEEFPAAKKSYVDFEEFEERAKSILERSSKDNHEETFSTYLAKTLKYR